MTTSRPSPLLTFVYGSNMLARRITKRCPSASALGVAELRAHELRWHKQSVDKSGKCDVVPVEADGAVVFGVLYEIATGEADHLDQAEGLDCGYQKGHVDVVRGSDTHLASVYRATQVNGSLKPYTWYKALVVAGAREHCLPGLYIARLELTEAIEDPDTARHDRNMKILHGPAPRR